MEEQAFTAFETKIKTNTMHFDTWEEFDGFLQSFDVVQKRKSIVEQFIDDGKVISAITERISSNEFKLRRVYKEIAYHNECTQILKNFPIDTLFTNLQWEIVSPWTMV